ncbi:MAG: cytochrome d ubiquinol oxidase subunit II [Haliea sp.]|jgi:cytochrome d ubiquinol oxidase subunit II|uniref:cytochrome d ubiquinol oxidase subunit II n=1 Tax=Haliea sp. TaxID=1932666 RepID=UPI000C49E7FA|nr:cytochrome d ubiquinol oxidase subunit II [Haliea sp.]MBM67890.1 cytochrome d ubiquinol oxidase subunit II [Haliea sp.]|tara:strand:- start:13783 stop:14787 length:1005 start_codon:yes stop_codon:yes gene_type:complete
MLDLPVIWAGLLALGIFIYVALDGFDLGIGLLFPFLATDQDRDTAMNTVAPVWDGNETWLILGGGGLFAAFPLAYAVVMPALYAPFIVMLLALVFRGVAFEYRWRDKAHERIWDASFVFGSVVATFMQGVVLGAFVQGIEVEGRAYAGGWWDWLTPFTLTVGVALCAGYALLGAGWLVLKTDGALRQQAYRLVKRAAMGTFFFVGVVSLWTPFLSPDIFARWFTLPHFYWLAPVPLLTIGIAGLVAWGIQRQRDAVIYPATLGLLGLCFIGLGVGFTPYIVPRAITVHEAAAPDSSLLFMLVGAVIMLPLILGYTAYSYWIFRGKVRHGDGGYH